MNRKRIFRWFVFSILMLSLTLSVFSKEEVNASVWTESAVVVDGQGTDWQDVQPFEKKKMKIDYAFKNDNNYLYVLFRLNDFEYLSTINSSGVTVWLNSDGKTKKKYGVKFLRRVITADHFIALIERQRGPLPEAQKAEIKKKESYTIYQNGVVNKGSDVVVPIKVASAQAPAFMVSQTREAMIFEFRIPLPNEEGKVVGIGTKPGEEIAVGFEWGGLTKEYKDAMTKKPGTRRGVSSKGGVSEEMPGSDEAGEIGASAGSGPSSRAAFARASTPKRYSFFSVVKLAEKK